MSAIDLATSNPIVMFRAQPAPLAADLRPAWRMASILCIMVLCGRGPQKRVSLRRLHALAWAARTQAHVEALAAQILGRHPTAALFVSVDPTLNAALDLLVAGKFVERDRGSHFRLSEAGQSAAKAIIDADLLVAERRRLTQIAKHANEGVIGRLLKGRRS